ncbi:hypothetical protein OZX72_07400 [Bifidobacterium sp. ESL0769]|uniref:hypothetical protein n=1 Tax=Bifidobacterium sp. ESL0769 TaxID=2983229 RepID=UPI0023F8E837|nr:hypothetical protein [Bifidobacterium sp. ESL0769]WEV67062.1 hypothetical protein OZX72_07400 [Bifidobacterium sp. ESL0769]
MNVKYERSGCKQFFKKHRDDEKTIKNCIENALDMQLKTGMSKVKRAVSARVGGQCVYEFRVNLKRTGSARVAFIVKDADTLGKSSDLASEENSADVTVLFISSTLQKDEFTHLLEHDLKEAGLCD